MFRDIDEKNQCVNACFSRVFRQFLPEFSIFLNRFSGLKFPLIATEYFAYDSSPSVESIKLIMTIEAKMGQHGFRSKCATFY